MIAKHPPEQYRSFNFLVELDGVVLGGFSEVSGLGTEALVVDYRDGGGKSPVARRLPQLHKVTCVTLKRGVVDSAAFAQWRGFPIIPCNLCGSQENLKRREIKQLMREWERRFPGRVENVFASLGRVAPSHLMDRERFDFAGLRATGEPVPDGDIAFDADDSLEAPRAPISAPARRSGTSEAVAPHTASGAARRPSS